MHSEEEKEPIEISPKSLSKEALHGVIESFVLREGTDYGLKEVDTATKIEQIHKQIQSGEVKIILDPNTESVGIVKKEDWLKS